MAKQIWKPGNMVYCNINIVGNLYFCNKQNKLQCACSEL